MLHRPHAQALPAIVAALSLQLAAVPVALGSEDAATKPSFETCDLSFGPASLSADERKSLAKGELVMRVVKQRNGFEMLYLVSHSDHGPDLVMGVYSAGDEHHPELGEFILASSLRPAKPNAAALETLTRYEIHVDWPYDNAIYTVRSRIEASQGGYLLVGELESTTERSFSPQWYSGFLRAVPRAGGSLIVACAYQVPQTDWFMDQYNETTRRNVHAMGKNLEAWVRRVAEDPARAHRYRKRLAKPGPPPKAKASSSGGVPKDAAPPPKAIPTPRSTP